MSLTTSIHRDLLDATSRVALAAMLHDIGKFAERARIEIDSGRLDSHKTIYCPFRHEGGYHSHVHAAYSAVVIEDLAQDLPDLVGENVFPFASWGQPGVDDSLTNAAARHHAPETFLQWIIATADRAASGLDREEFDTYNRSIDEKPRKGLNHYTTRQWTLFEQIRTDEYEPSDDGLKWRYPLQAFGPESIFPVTSDMCEGTDRSKAQAEYRQLWDEFRKALHQIPAGHHADNLPLWLDHFDTVWMIYTHAIPAATFKAMPDVSLYDHTKAVTALATALWRYHHEQGHDHDAEAASKAMSQRADWNEDKLLMVQGDLFGIQDFIFASGGQTQRAAARLLRGRSFYVSLLTECAALKILDALALPPTSQIINAAGKFRIVAPNTLRTQAILTRVQRELNQWFLDYTYGQAGIGLAWEPACCNDLQMGTGEGSPYRQLMQRLFGQLEDAKLRRFDFCGDFPPPAVFGNYLEQFNNALGLCDIDGRSPATGMYDGIALSKMAHDQITIGRELPRKQVLMISHRPLPQGQTLSQSIFGLHVHLIAHSEFQSGFTRSMQSRDLVRTWDLSLPREAHDTTIWHGLARRYVNCYVPRFIDTEAGESHAGSGFMDFKDLAQKALLFSNGTRQGVAALMTVKGDVDNLGTIFLHGLKAQSFSREAALSRQLNAYFAIYLPWLCQQEYQETYTVFAGGDDFFLIGPWRQQMQLVKKIRNEFGRYVREPLSKTGLSGYQAAGRRQGPEFEPESAGAPGIRGVSGDPRPCGGRLRPLGGACSPRQAARQGAARNRLWNPSNRASRCRFLCWPR